MELEIKPGRAKEDVKNIEDIVKKIDYSMADLNRILDELMPEKIETDWSHKMKDSWDISYKNGVQDIMKEMNQSAVNLQNAVDKAEEYSAH